MSALYENNQVAQALQHKWAKLLRGITNENIKMNTAVLLETQSQKPGLITEDPATVGSNFGVGTHSGQTANAGGFNFGAGDGTGAGQDIAPFQHYLLPLVRRVYPNLIANELVGVQPMTSPASLVFYLKYRYTGLVEPDAVQLDPRFSAGSRYDAVSAKGSTQPYTEYANFVGNTWNIDPYYSSQTVMQEAAISGNPTLVSTGALAWNLVTTPHASPVIANTVATQGGTLVFRVTDTVNTSEVTVTIDAAGQATGVPGFVGIGGPNVAGLGSAIILGTQVLNMTTGGVTIPLVAAAAITFTSPAVFGGTATRTYDYNMEGNRQMPEMELQVESFPVSAKTRKLRTKWTIEAAQDLRAMHNIDAEQELIAVLANEVTAEIDREIINDLVINATIRVDYDYSNPFLVGGLIGNTVVPGFTGSSVTGGSATYVPGAPVTPPAATYIAVPGSTNFEDRNKALFYQILEVSNQIYRQSLRGAGNWIVTSPEIASKLESLLEFKPDARTDTTYNLGIIYSGTLNGQFKVYKDPLFRPNLILVGYKGSSFMDAGFFYCPYVPLQLTPTVLDTESFNPRKGLITRYGKVLVENGGRMYGVIRVANIAAVGASTLPGQGQPLAAQRQVNSAGMSANLAASTTLATGGTLI